jgi:tripartite-type tricarboxylate transporter receptor subunit TctC
MAFSHLKFLGYLDDKRSKIFPEVQTAKEYGINVEGTSRNFIIVPKGVSKPIGERLHGIMSQVIEDPEFEKKLAGLANEAYYEDSEGSKAFLKEWYDTTKKLYEMFGMIKKK